MRPRYVAIRDAVFMGTLELWAPSAGQPHWTVWSIWTDTTYQTRAEALREYRAHVRLHLLFHGGRG